MNREMKDTVSGSSKARLVMAAIAAALVVSLVGVVGCSGSSSASSSASSASASSSTSASSVASSASSSSSSLIVTDKGVSSSASNVGVTVGPSSSSTASLVMDNELGQAITDIAFCATGTTGNLTYLMRSGQTWDNGVVAQVNYEKRAEGVNYDIHLKSGENEYVLHDIDLDGVREFTVRMENGVAYATFEQNGNAVNMQQQETDLARQLGTIAVAQAASSQPEAPAAEESAGEASQPEEEASSENAPEGDENNEEAQVDNEGDNDVVDEAPVQQEQS